MIQRLAASCTSNLCRPAAAGLAAAAQAARLSGRAGPTPGEGTRCVACACYTLVSCGVRTVRSPSCFLLFCLPTGTCSLVLQDAWGEMDRLHPPAASPEAGSQGSSRDASGADASTGRLEWEWMGVVWSRGLTHEHQQARHAGCAVLCWNAVLLGAAAQPYPSLLACQAGCRAAQTPVHDPLMPPLNPRPFAC